MLNGYDLSRGLRAAAYLGILAPALAAQALSLPASDPVGIGRAGAGVAFGRSLEAAALNPALLTTLLEPRSAYLALGEEFQSSQVSIQSKQQTIFSNDRNRFVPAFGAAWRLNERTVFGVKVDVPFLRHGQLPADTVVRFLGDELDLKTLRAELQLARSFGQEGQFSFGVALGAMKVDLTQGTVVRGQVGREDPSKPVTVDATNPSLGLVETRVTQQGSVTVGTFGLGFRWALNPRWTLGGSAQGFLKGSTHPTAEMGKQPLSFIDNDGFGKPPDGLEAKALLMLAASSPSARSGNIALPGRATLGLRHRVNNLFTWEADLRYVHMTSLELPSAPSLVTPSGRVEGPSAPTAFQNSLGLLVASELALTRRWTLRGGFSLEQGFRKDGDVEPLLGGARNSSYSLGVGLKAGGGEWNLGYQVRLSQDHENTNLQGSWSASGYHPTPGLTRVEGMGHLFSIGFRKSF